jgi:hypothetical protein
VRLSVKGMPNWGKLKVLGFKGFAPFTSYPRMFSMVLPMCFACAPNISFMCSLTFANPNKDMHAIPPTFKN